MVTRSDFNKYILPVYNPAKFIPKKAKGSYVWDQNNNKYLDFASGIAVSNLGNFHPTLVKTLNTQSKNLWHLSNVLANEPASKLSGPLSALLMPILGSVAAFGLARSGQLFMRAVLGMALGFAYFVADNFSLAMGNLGAYPPVLAAWAPFFLFLLVGETLLFRTEE